MHLTITNRGIRFNPVPEGIISIDIAFDDVRVWSVDLRNLEAHPPGFVYLDWPEPLLPYLHGSSLVSIRDSATHKELAATPHSFSDVPERVTVIDATGNPLAINKWGRLGKTLDRVDDSFRDRILSRTQELVQQLNGLGHQPFVVGGTLLGAVREGDLLPHDDDADLAYLSTHTNPTDVALEGLRLGQQLADLGHFVVRHSATHMQLHFFAPDGSVDHYVDVFAAFFTEDGYINQPFHVRGRFTRAQMLPFTKVNIRGIEFPAPRAFEDWLVINYDENWRTPIPGYHLGTPRSTRRRFQNWFGSFHFQRDFWNQLHTSPSHSRWASGASWIQRELAEMTAPTVVDLGTGDGYAAAALAESRPTHRVLGLDYSHSSQLLAAEHTAPNVEWGHINLYRLEAVALASTFGISGQFDVSLNHVLEQVGHHARLVALRIVRIALRSGGTAVATFYTKPVPNVKRQDPTGWHLERVRLVEEAATFGLNVSFTDIAAESSSDSARGLVGVRFSLSSQPSVVFAERKPMASRLKDLVKRVITRPDVAEIEDLRTRISELERDLDGYRQDSLRVAELLDLAERMYTPDGPGTASASLPEK